MNDAMQQRIVTILAAAIAYLITQYITDRLIDIPDERGIKDDAIEAFSKGDDRDLDHPGLRPRAALFRSDSGLGDFPNPRWSARSGLRLRLSAAARLPRLCQLRLGQARAEM